MPEFAYKAIDPKGREKSGRLAAASDEAARAKLTERNFYVVSVETAQGRPGKTDKASSGLFGPKKLTSKELTLFTRQLSSLAQVSPLEEALRLIGNQNEKPHVQQRIASVHGGVIEGQRLSAALSGDDCCRRDFRHLARYHRTAC